MRKTFDKYNPPPEFMFMLSLALQNIPQMQDSVDFEKFDTLVKKNRIQPLILAGIKKMPSEYVQNNDVFQKLIDNQSNYSLTCICQIQALAESVDIFTKKGIRVLSLKGPILASEIYGDPALRTSRDLDILVSESDLDKACEELENLGYTKEINVFNKTPLRKKLLEKNGEEMHRVYKKGNICIELHWRLSFRINISFDDLWKSSRKTVLFGKEIHYLGEYDNISYLITHAAGHGYHRLRWLIDIYELFKKSNTDLTAVYEYMANLNVGTLFLETLFVIYSLPNLSLPPYSGKYFSIEQKNNTVIVSYSDNIKKDIDTALKLTKAAYPILTNHTDANGINERRYNSLLPTVGRKYNLLRFISELFAPSRAELERFDLPDKLYFLYYFIRPFYKLWRMTPFYHADFDMDE